MAHDQWCEAHLVPTAWNTAGFCNCRRRELSAEVAALRQERDAARALLRECLPSIDGHLRDKVMQTLGSE